MSERFNEKKKSRAWGETLGYLKGKLTAATFNAWLAGTKVLSSDGDNSYVIGVKNAFAKDWLDNRLRNTVVDALSTVCGVSVDIQFVVNDVTFPSGEDTDDHPVVEPRPQSFCNVPPALNGDPGAGYAQTTNFHQTLYTKIGHNKLSHYSAQFVQAYLGTNTFAVWSYINSLEKTDAAKNLWTPPVELSSTELAQRLGKRNRGVIDGRRRECTRSEEARKADCHLSECYGCMGHPVHEFGEGKCYYWISGALEILQRERILAISVEGTRRGKVMRFQVIRILPLLTPYQVYGSLSSHLQKEHDYFLRNYRNVLGISLEEWREIAIPSLVPFMEGYEEKELHGYHEFNPMLKTSQAENFMYHVVHKIASE